MKIHAEFEVNPNPPFDVIRQIGKKMYICDHCGKQFGSEDDCKAHEAKCKGKPSGKGFFFNINARPAAGGNFEVFVVGSQKERPKKTYLISQTGEHLLTDTEFGDQPVQVAICQVPLDRLEGAILDITARLSIMLKDQLASLPAIAKEIREQARKIMEAGNESD